jgi:hypothetical protein
MRKKQPPADPTNCRENHVLALPPARKGMQVTETMNICAPNSWAKALSRPFNGRKIKSIYLILNLCIFFAPRDTLDLHTKKTRTTSAVYPRQTTDYSKKLYHKSTHHNVLFSTEIRDTNLYASPEGAKRLPPRGDDWRQKKGTLGAAMRLKALSHAPPVITRQPKNPRQHKIKRKAKQTNPHPNNTMPTCYVTVNSPHSGAVRGKLEGPRGARVNMRTCLSPCYGYVSIRT